jgi:biopolymer transport protein ExbD
MISVTPGKKKQLDQSAVPTTSLADMMFLLLIFFIMTTTLTRTSGFVTDVPAGAKGASDSSSKTPTVLLHDGKISIESQNYSVGELRAYLRGLHLEQRTGDGKVVVISAAGKVNYQQYYEVMASVRNSGGVVAIVSEEGGQK